eukprot:3847930-Rhodomonas_salina.1
MTARVQAGQVGPPGAARVGRHHAQQRSRPGSPLPRARPRGRRGVRSLCMCARVCECRWCVWWGTGRRRARARSQWPPPSPRAPPTHTPSPGQHPPLSLLPSPLPLPSRPLPSL